MFQMISVDRIEILSHFFPIGYAQGGQIKFTPDSQFSQPRFPVYSQYFLLNKEGKIRAKAGF